MFELVKMKVNILIKRKVVTHATGVVVKTSTNVVEEVNLSNEGTGTFEYVVDETSREVRGQEDEEPVGDETRKFDMDTLDAFVYQSS